MQCNFFYEWTKNKLLPNYIFGSNFICKLPLKAAFLYVYGVWQKEKKQVSVVLDLELWLIKITKLSPLIVQLKRSKSPWVWLGGGVVLSASLIVWEIIRFADVLSIKNIPPVNCGFGIPGWANSEFSNNCLLFRIHWKYLIISYQILWFIIDKLLRFKMQGLISIILTLSNSYDSENVLAIKPYLM